MPRIIFKCPYIQGGSKEAASHLQHYVSYVATRSGVERIPVSKRDLPATKRQTDLVARIIKDFPLSKGMFEYEDYLASPTRGNASEFISRAMEDNYDKVAKLDNYMKYIAERPGAQVVESHGLFTATDEPLVLSQVADAVANHSGNVWLPIISLRREDAQRVGYDNAEQWRSLLRSCAMEMAEQMRIPWEQFRWYAAFHNESTHPHIHMVCYSADGKSGFLTTKGIKGIKSMLAKEIFRQELTEIYAEQTLRRNKLTMDAAERLKELIQQMQSGEMENDRIVQLMEELSRRLKFLSGKKQYGYLKAPLKALVNEIVDELARDERIKTAYDLWYEMREEVLRTYGDKLPERVPLSQQKELKRIKNAVIEEAIRLGEQTAVLKQADAVMEQEQPDMPEEAAAPEMETSDESEAVEHTHPPVVEWSDRYRAARLLLFGDDQHPQNFDAAHELFLKEALAGNALAMHDLARMYADGLGREIDADLAQIWYTKALRAFLSVEAEQPDRYVEYRIGKMYAAGLGAEQSYADAAEWFARSAAARYKYAQYSLAGLYYHGNGVEQDYERALRLYTGSAKQGFPYAAYELGKMYRDGVGCTVDEAKAAAYFENAFRGFLVLEGNSHDDKLQYRIGQMLFDGLGTEKDEVSARKWFERSARSGNTYAQYRLAKLTLADPGSPAERIAEAIDWLTRAAQAGQENAQYALGKLYLEEAHKDVSNAVMWLTEAAEQGNQYAQYTLGKLCLLDKDVPRDREEAVHWFTLSAAQGNEYAQYFLDHMNDPWGPSPLLYVTRLLRHMGRIFEDNPPPKPRGAKFTDRKLLQKIREKKMAHGHKPNDHEDMQMV